MKNAQIKTYNDIDWTLLRDNAMQQKARRTKGPEDWDKRADSFSKRTRNTDYIDLFLAELPLHPSSTVLDIGSGPGTLSLPIAKKVRQVTAVDFSAEMLKILDQRAEDEGCPNIATIHCAWEDDWKQSALVPHDIAIASRSIGVKDLKQAILKINAFAKQAVFISDRINPTPFEAEAYQAIGRPFTTGPDYIYTLNLLYSLGIHANVKVLRSQPTAVYKDIEAALASYDWMFDDLSEEERQKLTAYIESNIQEQTEDRIVVRRRSPIQWALLWWKKSEYDSGRKE